MTPKDPIDHRAALERMYRDHAAVYGTGTTLPLLMEHTLGLYDSLVERIERLKSRASSAVYMPPSTAEAGPDAGSCRPQPRAASPADDTPGQPAASQPEPQRMFSVVCPHCNHLQDTGPMVQICLLCGGALREKTIPIPPPPEPAASASDCEIARRAYARTLGYSPDPGWQAVQIHYEYAPHLAALRAEIASGQNALDKSRQYTADLLNKLAALRAEIAKLKEEISEGDYWQKRSIQSQENGTCPWCFCSDEAGHNKGCYLGETEQEREEWRERATAKDAEITTLKAERDAAKAETKNERGRVESLNWVVSKVKEAHADTRRKLAGLVEAVQAVHNLRIWLTEDITKALAAAKVEPVVKGNGTEKPESKETP